VALQEQFVPGQAHLGEVEAEFAALNLPRATQAAPLRTVVSNSSGFGGSNVALVLRAAQS
jgi:3-oxoacyl-(acyl-carrier-protein) synthase